MTESGWSPRLHVGLASALCLFAVAEVNYQQLSPQSQLAIFAMLGMLLCFLNWPLHVPWRHVRALRVLDGVLALGTIACCSFIVVQSETAFQGLWIDGITLGNRAGQESSLDLAVGVVGLLLVIEAARRSLGWALPILAGAFLAYAYLGPSLPDWLFPHRGYDLNRIVSQVFLQGQGVFGTALRVMFVYVFLFVIFGALLQSTGATRYIIDFARRVFGNTRGGPAKISVLSSGLMGSLSGSAVANTATTGTFTIPMMRSSGFRPEIAAGIEAAASSGGALVPPVMGAGAYMMLEIIEPPVTYLQIVKAALIPALLYYASLLLIVHFYARKIDAGAAESESGGSIRQFEGLVFVAAFGALIGLLLSGFTVFGAVTRAMLVVLVVAAFHPRTRLGPRKLLDAIASAGRDVVPLVAAAACVGVVIGVVTLTGVGTKLPATILSLAQGDLLSALVLIMISSIVLGMGLPSAVCYLLMATLIGSALSDLGVVPLSAHLFIFYFGMMSMVTPPVALAAYTAASIAGAGIMSSSLAAFRFALVGFTLPYMFVFRPELLMLSPDGGSAPLSRVLIATGLALLGIVPFAAAIAGHLFAGLGPASRAALFVASGLLLIPSAAHLDLVGLTILAAVAAVNWRAARSVSTA